MSNAVLDAALQYADLGFSIVPMVRGEKRPKLRSWEKYQSEPADHATLKRWFRNGDANLAIVLGNVSGGIICRDFDEMKAYEQWAGEHPQLAAALPTVRTHRGRHVYARTDVDALHQRTGRTICNLGHGELRAGGLCVLPPSIHPAGTVYRWLVPLEGPLPMVDVWDAGFFPACNIEGIERREDVEHRENPEHRETEITQKPRTLKKSVIVSIEPKDFSVDVRQEINEAINKTLPTGKAQRHRLTFDLCRALKAIPSIADAHPMQLMNIVRAWWERAKEHSATPFEEHFIDFAEGWGKVQYPLGSEPMTQILNRATAGTIPEAALQFDQEPLRLLVAICRELQRATGKGPFFLSSRTAGRLLGVDHTTTHRWLRGLTHYGILELVEAGSQNPKDRKASRFRYLGKLD